MDTFKTEIVPRLKDKLLIPFYITVITYYILYEPYWGLPPVTIAAAFYKVLPIWSLVLYIRISSIDKSKSFFPNQDYSKFIMVGLIASNFGDSLLVSRDTLLIPGMLMFGIAHLFYMYAMKGGNGSNRLTQLFILGAIVTFLTFSSDMESSFMKTTFLVYVIVIFITGWKATTCFEMNPDSRNLAAALGMVVFMFSDFILSVDIWKFQLPLSEFIVMTSYYIAQLFLAISTKLPLHHKER